MLLFGQITARDWFKIEIIPIDFDLKSQNLQPKSINKWIHFAQIKIKKL